MTLALAYALIRWSLCNTMRREGCFCVQLRPFVFFPCEVSMLHFCDLSLMVSGCAKPVVTLFPLHLFLAVMQKGWVPFTVLPKDCGGVWCKYTQSNAMAGGKSWQLLKNKNSGLNALRGAPCSHWYFPHKLFSNWLNFNVTAMEECSSSAFCLLLTSHPCHQGPAGFTAAAIDRGGRGKRERERMWSAYLRKKNRKTPQNLP